MAEPHALVAGLALTFAQADMQALRLVVELTEPTPVVLQWGALTRTSSAARRHTFDRLPVRPHAGVEWVLRAGPATLARRLAPVSEPDRLRFGLLSADVEAGPLAAMLEPLGADGVHWVMALGDADAPALPGRRALPLTSRRPVVRVGACGGGALCPDDPVAAAYGLPGHVFHLRAGPLILWALDPGLSLAPDGAQARFVAAVAAAHPGAPRRLIAVPADPMASDPRGRGAALLALAEGAGVELVLAGQGRRYARRQHGPVAVVVASGSSASRASEDGWPEPDPQTRATIAAPGWVRVDVTAAGARVAALGLEGTLIDEAPVPDPRARPRRPIPWVPVAGVIAALAAGLLVVAVGLLRAGRSPR